MQFRIGINLGDVIVEEDDIFGDGVNVAARLEVLAEPGGICVPAAVRDQVGDRLRTSHSRISVTVRQEISRPIRMFRSGSTGAGAGDLQAARKPDMAARKLCKPTMAVLPFANMSGDPEQEFFADGLTEDIMTELARRHELFVISRTSIFVYKGKSANPKEVARKLGATMWSRAACARRATGCA